MIQKTNLRMTTGILAIPPGAIPGPLGGYAAVIASRSGMAKGVKLSRAAFLVEVIVGAAAARGREDTKCRSPRFPTGEVP